MEIIAMLSTKPLSAKDAKKIVRYCKHKKPRPDARHSYYNSGAPSAWAGRLAAENGLVGAVGDHDFLDALEGRIGQSDLGKTRADRRAGHDVTLSAPKSVSMMCLIGGDERIAVAHDAAVKEALKFVEREVAKSRFGKNGVKTRSGGGIAAAVFRHEDARSVDGPADPQLHSHCIIINATNGPDGLRAVDLDWGEQAVRMRLADAVYKSALARRLVGLGYGIEQSADGFEIAGVPASAIEHFSQRRGQIDEALVVAGLDRETSTAGQRTAANLRTRQSKSGLARDDQQQEWRERSAKLGLGLTFAARSAIKSRPRPVPESAAGAAVRSAARHLSERATVFSKDQARLEALKTGMGGATIDQIDRAIINGEAGLIDAGGGQVTTQDSIYRESLILAAARAGRDQIPAINLPDEAAQFIAQRESDQGWHYGSGQRAVISLALTTSDRHIAVVGSAGAGKTTAMNAIVAAARAGGIEVLGLAPSTSAARELRSAGCDSTTIASFLAKPPPGRGRLILVDESGMIGSDDMERLIAQIESSDDRAIFVGDPRQLASVSAGSPFAQMIESASLATASITEIQRQKSPELLAIASAFASGNAAQAVVAARPFMCQVAVQTDNRGEDGKPLPTTMERRSAIAAATAQVYLNKSQEDRSNTLVLSGTNAVRRQVNDLIRAGLKQEKAIGGDEIEIIALDKVDATKEALTRAVTYKSGMIVRLYENKRMIDYTVRAVAGGDVILVDDAGAKKKWKPVAGARVYTGRRMAVARGDRVVFREPIGKGAERITNGASGTIEAVDLAKGTAAVRLDDGRTTVIDRRHGVAIDRGWCLTTHLAQGKTVDSVIVAGEASRVATAESAYVACSRERYQLSIITDNFSRLSKSWAGWAERKTALGATGGGDEVDRERLAELRRAAAEKLAEPPAVRPVTAGEVDRARVRLR